MTDEIPATPSSKRSAQMGFNHNFRHLGFLFHVQTEDTGPHSGHVETNLLCDGAVVASKRTPLPPAATASDTRSLMRDQHKTVLRELRDGLWDEKIRDVIGHAICAGTRPLPPIPTPVRAPAPVELPRPTPPPFTQAQTLLAFPLPEPEPPVVEGVEINAPLPSSPPSPWPTMVMPAEAMQRVREALTAWRNEPTVSGVVSPGAPVMQRLVAEFTDIDAFMRSTYRRGDVDGLFVLCNEEVHVGTGVVIDMRFTGGPVDSFPLHGKVAWAKVVNGQSGVGVDLAPEETGARERLVRLLSGNGVARLTRRINASIKVQVRGQAWGPLDATTGDISEGGIFIKTRTLVPVGQVIRVRMIVPSLPSLDVDAVVTSQRQGRSVGLGARFLFGSQVQLRHVKDVLAAVQGKPVLKAA